MKEKIIIRDKPRIEFHLMDKGFEILDSKSEKEADVHAYNDIQRIELNNVWFPLFAKWMRVITWIANGVPYFPDAKSCKKANFIIHFSNSKYGTWLTSTKMAKKTRRLKTILDNKI